MNLICINTCSGNPRGAEILNSATKIIESEKLDPKEVDICLFGEKLYSNMKYGMLKSIDPAELDIFADEFSSESCDYGRCFKALDMERSEAYIDHIYVITTSDVFDAYFGVPTWMHPLLTWCIIGDESTVEDIDALPGEVVFYDDFVLPTVTRRSVDADRDLVESMVKKYGVADVMKFVTSINEGKKSDSAPEKNIFLSTFKRLNHQALVWICKYIDGKMVGDEKKMFKEAVHSAAMDRKQDN